MESPIQEPPSLSELCGRAIRFLFDNCRPQFHPSLYGRIYAATYVAIFQIGIYLVSLTPWFSLVINFELVGILVGCLSVAELVRGHAKHWHGCAVEEWCYVAMPFGGAALTTTFWGIIHLMWGRSAWYEPLLYALAGAVFYTLLGWLLHLEEKKKAKKVKSS